MQAPGDARGTEEGLFPGDEHGKRMLRDTAGGKKFGEATPTLGGQSGAQAEFGLSARAAAKVRALVRVESAGLQAAGGLFYLPANSCPALAFSSVPPVSHPFPRTPRVLSSARLHSSSLCSGQAEVIRFLRPSRGFSFVLSFVPVVVRRTRFSFVRSVVRAVGDGFRSSVQLRVATCSLSWIWGSFSSVDSGNFLFGAHEL